MVKSEIISKLSKKIHHKLKRSEIEKVLEIIFETINKKNPKIKMSRF